MKIVFKIIVLMIFISNSSCTKPPPVAPHRAMQGAQSSGATADQDSQEASKAESNTASTQPTSEAPSPSVIDTSETSSTTTTEMKPVPKASDPIPPPTPGKTIRIMPLGASITQGSVGSKVAGYRSVVHRLLNANNIPHELVGSNRAQPADLPVGQRNHEGHPGWTIEGVTGQINNWLGPQGVDPDYILILVGSNDITQKYKLDEIGDRLDTLIDRIANKKTGLKPEAQVIVASVPRMTVASEEAENVKYAAKIEELVVKRRIAGENVSYVDVHAALMPEDKFDNLHPNDAGYEKIGALWVDRILGK